MSVIFVLILSVLPAGMLWALSYLAFRRSRPVRLAFCFGIFAVLTGWFWPVSLFFAPIGLVGLIVATTAFEWAVAKDTA
jgi:hypothetical protein